VAEAGSFGHANRTPRFVVENAMPAARANPRRGLVRRDVAVIVLLLVMGLLLVFPWILHQRTDARRNQCDLRQQRLAKAILQYEQTTGGLPGYRNLQAVDRDGTRRPASWVFSTLPYLEFDDKQGVGPYFEIAKKYGPLGGDDTRGKPPQDYLVALICPENLPPKPTPGWLSYVASCGLPDAEPAGDFPPDWPANGIFLDRFREPVRDAYPYLVTREFLITHDDSGPQESYTLLISENVDSGLWTDTAEARIGFVWTPDRAAPRVPPVKRILRVNQRRGEGRGGIEFARPSANHVGGVMVAYASGATSFLNESVSPVVLARAMAADDAGLTWPASDEPIGPPYRRVESDTQP
jgi:hypothetical protein